MFACCLVGLLCGLLFGVRFKVFAIVAVEILATLVLAGLLIVGDVTWGRAVMVFVCWSACLQLGYILMLVATSMVLRASRVTASRA